MTPPRELTSRVQHANASPHDVHRSAQMRAYRDVSETCAMWHSSWRTWHARRGVMSHAHRRLAQDELAQART